MKKFLQSKLSSLILLGVIALVSLINPSEVYSQYCTPSYSYAGNYMGIEYVEVGDMSNSTGWEYAPGYSYFSTKVVNMKPNDMVNFVVNFGYTYPMELVIFVDWNGDEKFDSKTEMVYESGGSGSLSGYSGDFTVPADAKFGNTRMRVMCEYAYQTYPSDPCYTGYYYGECEDYVVNVLPNAPDASISALTSPVKPFRVGNHPINVTLKSGNKAALKSVFIDWWLNNVPQTTYKWTGTLNENQTASINLGTLNLDYPAGTTNFTPFAFRFQTRGANDFDEDGNSGNDIYNVSLAPILNDAGVLGFFGPPEGFGPGVTQVRARIRNYSPKPLTSVTVYWKVDNVAQTPVTLTGINIPANQSQDLVLGTYNFYAKTPLGPFTVECYTTLPNGVTDEDQTNDKYNGGIGPSLAAGTYTIGGSTAHFASPAEAASYINSSGVFGNGLVKFMINPGTYTGQVILNSPLPRKNPIQFVGNSQFPGDVIIQATPTAQNNFIVLLDGMTDISFTNLTFRNNASNTSNAGMIVDAKNVNGLNFDNITFFGVANSPRYNPYYSLISILNCNNLNIHHNSFSNGSVGVYHLDVTVNNPKLLVNNNDFTNFSWVGIWNQILDNLTIGQVSFADNRFISNSGLAPVGGISSTNSTSILRNEFSGIVGTGNANEAVINVKHTTQNMGETADILGNRINSATNINGIIVDGAYTFVKDNYVNVAQSGTFTLAAFKAINAIGVVGNNQLIGNAVHGIHVTGSPNLDFYYNSVNSESGTYPTLLLNNAGKLWRNIFNNNGTGRVYQITGALNVKENILYTKGTNLATVNSTNYANLATWQAAGYDQNSGFAAVEFESFNDLKIKYYTPALLKSVALFAGDNGKNGMIESNDIYGTPRSSYFVGSHELLLAITIERQTDGFTDCVGSTTNYLTVSSAINYNAPMTYKWELDGRTIAGETEPILYFKNLKHTQSGIYRCLVNGPGATLPVYSRPVSVYVTRPTDITRQPEPNKAPLGSLVTLTFDAHVNGMNIEDAIANNEVTVQWFKYINEADATPLVDNKWIAGSKSNYLTFKNFRAADEGEYFAIINGLCGTVKTDLAAAMVEVVDLTITTAPADASVCTSKDATFTVVATTQSDNLISYAWMKDGVVLANIAGKIMGANTNTLTILNISSDDKGTYTAKVKLVGTTLEENPYAQLTVINPPVIKVQPQDATVEAGKQLLIDVIAEGDDLTYSWYKDGELLQESSEPSYMVNPSAIDDAGEYYVIVSNTCDKVKSDNITVAITTGTTSVIESKNGYSLATATPNPVNEFSQIGFSVPTESFVKITLTDATGMSTIIIAEGNYSAGSYTINLDSKSLNLVSGTYYYFLESNGVRLSQKMVVIR